MFRLPAKYIALTSLLRERTPSDQRSAWLGDVGYLLPHGNPDEGAWLERLAQDRWRGMHPDLIPFAQDGFGNRFCFVNSEREAMRGVRAVVYWMYETYRAVPIASSFDAFLGWSALTAWITARRDDPVIDEDHVNGEIVPMLREIGIDIDPDLAFDRPDLDAVGVHRAVLNLDPNAPGAKLGLATWMMEHDRPIEALDLCSDANLVFPELAGARALAARVHLQDHDSERLGDALVHTLQRPLVYSGDEAMPFLRDLRPINPDELLELLSTQYDIPELVIDQPLSTFVTQEEGGLPRTWIQLALDYAIENQLERSAIAATNALYLGFSSTLGAEIHGLLDEIYTALGWDWHARMVRRWGPDGETP